MLGDLYAFLFKNGSFCDAAKIRANTVIRLYDGTVERRWFLASPLLSERLLTRARLAAAYRAPVRRCSLSATALTRPGAWPRR